MVKKTAGFVRKSLTGAELERLVDHLSFESMKKNSYVHYTELTEHLTKVHGVDRGTDFIGKGNDDPTLPSRVKYFPSI